MGCLIREILRLQLSSLIRYTGLVPVSHRDAVA